MSYQPTFAAILLADAEDGSGSPIAIRLEGEEARSMAYWRRRAFDHAQITTRLLVMGCHAEELLYGEADDGWEPIMNPHWEAGPAKGAAIAMQRLPLMDGLFMSACDESPMIDLGQHFDRMVDYFHQERLKLARVIIPTIKGEDAWPWLIDIGFRQYFVGLAEDGDFSEILEEFADQIRRIEIA